MKIDYKSKSLEFSPRVLAYLTDKTSRFDKFFRKEPTLGANLNLLRGKYICELTLEVSGRVIKASGQGSDMESSIDGASDKLDAQIRRFHARVFRKDFKALAELKGLFESQIPVEQLDDVPETVVKRKEFSVVPMSEEEAILQLEMLGHQFYVYRSFSSNKICVLYRRNDGGYGLIEVD
ncbi:MAG: ribosome-associated translation inhibitor RaiA [Caldisericota bacterium]|jgi:putative sigma-54 modulation protein|nr:ribosome-associated translation inhibitor RaiA [Caldisericota bacterium]